MKLISKLNLIGLVCSLFAANGVAEKFEARPIGILHMDVATYFGNLRHDFATGVALPEVRLGADGKYGSWNFRMLVGFADNKVKARDIYVQYNFNADNYIRGGHFVHQYGYQNSTAAFDKPTIVGASCETAFNLPQRVGVAYVHTDSLTMFSGSVYTPDDVIANAFGHSAGKIYHQSFGIKCRTAYHPFIDSEKLIGQIGFSAQFETPHTRYLDNGEVSKGYFNFSVPFPTKVHNVTAIAEEVADARNRWEVTPDLMIAHKRLALETQYYYTRVNTLYSKPYFRGEGFYVNLRGILIGKNYEFSKSVAGLANPLPGSLEGILTFDYTDMGYHHQPGNKKVMETAAIFNYYINKYMTLKFRGGLTHLPGQTDIAGVSAPSLNLFTLQARYQLIF